MTSITIYDGNDTWFTENFGDRVKLLEKGEKFIL